MPEDSRSSPALFFGLFLGAAVLVTLLMQAGILGGDKKEASGKPATIGAPLESHDVDSLISAYKDEAAKNAQRARKLYRGRQIQLLGTIKRVGMGSLLLEGLTHTVRVYMKDDLMDVSVSDTVQVMGVTEVPYFEAMWRDVPAMTVRRGKFVK